MTNKIPKKKTGPGVDNYGRTDLHHAASKGETQKIAELIEKGADLNLQDDDGWTALHFAAQERHLETVGFLLKQNANPNLINSHGNSPLFPAIMNCRGEFEIVQQLLAAGASPTHKNNHGKSPHDVAMIISWNGLKEIFQHAVKV